MAQALDAMLKEDGEDASFSSIVQRFLEPAVDAWYETGTRISRPELAKRVKQARLKLAEERARLASSEADALRKELGEPHAIVTSITPHKLSVRDFLEQAAISRPDALESNASSTMISHLRQYAARQGLDPEAVIAMIPQFRQELRKRSEAETVASVAARKRLQGALKARS